LEQRLPNFRLDEDGYVRSLTYKNRVFAIQGFADVQCLELTTGNVCSGFPRVVGYRPYTLNVDAERDGCIWTNSDSGVAHAFDALTGGRCTGLPTAPLVLVAKPLEATRCVPTSISPTWRSIVLSVPASGVVTAKIFDAATSAVLATRQFASGSTSLDISDISFAAHNSLRAELTIGASGTGQSMAAEILWNGPAPQFCTQTRTSSTNCAIAGDWSAKSGLVGSTTPLYSSSVTGKGLAFAAPLQDYSVSSSASSTDITTSPLVFKGRFDERAQTGDLWVTRIQASTGKEMIDPATSQVMVLAKASNSGVIPTAASRQVLTQLPDTTSALGATTAFRWSQLSPAQQAQLNRNLGGVTDTLGSKRVDYLRGSTADESPNATVPTGKFRKRSGSLGMVLGSGLTYVPTRAIQNRSESAAPGYESFLLNPVRTRNMVYMAANDGMLHGFRVTDNASTSVSLSEQFAYMPRRLLSEINRYSDSTAFQLWANPYFHDNTPMVNDILRNGAWSTVLVSAFGRGAPGFAALDITRGDAVTETSSNLVIREFTDQEDADMGYIVSQPTVNDIGYATQIVNVKRGGVVRPAVIMGNGIRSRNERAALFVVFLDSTGGYEKLVLPGVANGLSTPRVLDLNGDGLAETVYAGDLLGNVWRINITNATASAMTSTRLYTAMAPIASAPLAKLFSPVGNCRFCTMVNVATGRPTVGPLLYDFSPGQNAVYGLWDTLQASPIPTSSLVANYTLNNGTAWQFVGERTVDYNGTTSSKLGWMYALPFDQMVVANPAYRDNGVSDFFTVGKPGLSGSTCQAAFGWTYALLSATGNAPTRTFDRNNDGQVNGIDMVLIGGAGAHAIAGMMDSSRNLGQVSALRNGSDVAKNLNADGSIKSQGARVMVPQRLSWQEMDR
jgi:type IV pilus assembly protein PilY1